MRWQLPLSEVPEDRRAEVLEARKRVIFKRRLAQLDIPYDKDAPTDDLRRLYFLSLGYNVQRQPEDPRRKFKNWMLTEWMKEQQTAREREAIAADRRRREEERIQQHLMALAYVFGDR